MLVADDEDDIRALVGLAVAKAGCTVIGSVADGAAALSTARADLPDLAVLDVSMPGATGLGGLRRPARRPRHRSASASCCSRPAPPWTTSPPVWPPGADAYLAKPFQVSGPGPPGPGPHREAARVTTVEVGTAVLRPSAPRLPAAASPRRPGGLLDRPCRPPRCSPPPRSCSAPARCRSSTANWSLAGLATAFLATIVPGSSPPAAGDGALVVPLAHLGAVGLLSAGTGSGGVLFLVLGPLLTLVLGPGGAACSSPPLGTAAVLLLPGLTSRPPPTDVPARHLLLGPLAVGLGGLAVNETTRRSAPRRRDRAAARPARGLLTQVQTRADELDLATRMLAARAQTMTSVIDAVTEQSIIGTDRDGVIRVWNPGAEKMLGLPRPEVVRKRSIVEFHLPEELEAAAEDGGSAAGLAALVHAAQEHGSDVRDWTYVAADGQQRTVSVAVTPRTDDRGVHAGWNFVGTDMTEARATERMKDQFVSLISHELRTPLTSILGYLELVLDDEEQTLTDEQRTYLTTVERNADRLLRLVGDLLFTAQVDAGRFTLQPEDVDLATVVRAAEETVASPRTAGVEVVVDVPEDGLVVPGDAVRWGRPATTSSPTR